MNSTLKKIVLQILLFAFSAGLLSGRFFLGWGSEAFFSALFFINIALLTICLDLAAKFAFCKKIFGNMIFAVYAIVSVVGLMIVSILSGLMR